MINILSWHWWYHHIIHLCEAFKPKSRIQAVLEIWDIAGLNLVKGAHEGQGLGNEFLANIQCSWCNISRWLDPVRDIKIIANWIKTKRYIIIK